MKKKLNKIPFSFKLSVSTIYLALITTLFVLPLKDLPRVPLFPGEDKLIHAGLYFILVVLLLWTFYDRKNILWLLFTFVIFWGFMMEVTQLLMHAGRNFSFFDMLANITGAFLGVLVFKILRAKMK